MYHLTKGKSYAREVHFMYFIKDACIYYHNIRERNDMMSSSNYFQEIKDYGPAPVVINIDRAAGMNPNFRTVLWTGRYLQVTLMSIPVGGDIGTELHESTDQFIRIEQGCGLVRFGQTETTLKDVRKVNSHFAIIIPAGTWHNIVNCGTVPLRLYSVYAPPHHPFGTVQKTKEEAEK